MADEFDPKRLRAITESMIEAITSPEFVDAMRAVRSAPVDQRLAEGSRRLSPEALRAQGVKLPSDMRISSRYFEAGLPVPIEVGDYPGGRINLVNALNEVEPGLLDRLRTNSPELFRELVTVGRRPDEFLPGNPRDPGLAGFPLCACMGSGSFCAGGGTEL